MDENREHHYFVPCPHCGELIEFEWKQVFWEQDNPETAAYICQHCGGRITDHDKERMIQAGCWRQVEQKAHHPNMRLWVNPLYSTTIRFSDAVKEFLRSRNDPDLMKNFVTFWLAELWE